MSKFKVGDKVRFIEIGHWSYEIGQVYTILSVGPGSLVQVSYDKPRCYGSRFELAEAATTKKSKQKYEEVVF